MIYCWLIGLASIILLLFTANASEANSSSLTVLSPFPKIGKRYLSDDGVVDFSHCNVINISFYYEKFLSSGYRFGIEDSYVCYEIQEPHLFPVSCQDNKDEEWKDALEYSHFGVCPIPGIFNPCVEQFGFCLESVVFDLDVSENDNSSSLESYWGLYFLFGVVFSLSLLLQVVSGLYSSVKKHKFINLKSKLFRKNGGSLLEQYIASHGFGAGGAQIFTSEELEMSTETRHTSCPGPGASSSTNGRLYKSISPADSTVVEIVKEKVIVEEGQIECFINELITLAQINHQHVIRFLGCCLETEVPILVYEFASNGTLFDWIHNRTNGEVAMPWDILLEVAAESAAGLAYLHSKSIIHGNIRSSNILLTDSSAKVSGLGAPRFNPSNELQMSTFFQKTLGYLDPEYLLTGQLTYNSDVYSFGVLLVEILSGKKPISFRRPENQRIITSHFVSCMELRDGLFEILAPQVLNEGNKEQVRAVADLAKRCLKFGSAERPTMEEVAGELKRLTDTNPTVLVIN